MGLLAEGSCRRDRPWNKVHNQVCARIIQDQVSTDDPVLQLLGQARQVQQQRGRSGLERQALRILAIYFHTHTMERLRVPETGAYFLARRALESSCDLLPEI